MCPGLKLTECHICILKCATNEAVHRISDTDSTEHRKCLPFGSNLNLFMPSVHRTLLNIFSLNPTSIYKNYNISHRMAWVCANSISFHINI